MCFGGLGGVLYDKKRAQNSHSSKIEFFIFTGVNNIAMLLLYFIDFPGKLIRTSNMNYFLAEKHMFFFQKYLVYLNSVGSFFL